MRYLVIGGGIVGLATAYRIMTDIPGAAVTVVEKERSWAAHQTGHNSGVIHAGVYYRPGSLKARLCVAGNRSMLRFCAEQDIPARVTGKLVVATEERELPALRALHERAVANGLTVTALDPDQARRYEPAVATVGALHVAQTGIVDYAAVSRRLASLLERGGARMLRGTRVTGLAGAGQGPVRVRTTGGDLVADTLVNCAGLYADRIARLAGLRPQARIVPFRGEYHVLRPDRAELVRGLIYPVPDPELPFLGVHLTRMIDGSVHAGPNAVLALAREGYRWRRINLMELAGSAGYPGLWRLARQHWRTGLAEVRRSASRRRFAASLARLVPGIGPRDIVRAEAGVRAQAIRPDGALVDDFLIQRAPGQVHVLNAPSPAATSCLEIGGYIVADLPR